MRPRDPAPSALSRSWGAVMLEDFAIAEPRRSGAVDTAAGAAPGPGEAELIRAEERGQERGFADGFRQGLEAEAAARSEAATRVLAGIATALADADRAARQAAEDQAGSLARLLLAAMQAAFPSLCRRFGAAEAAAMARAIQPALRIERSVCVQVNPRTRDAAQSALDTLDAELRGRLTVVEADAVAEDDVRVEWQDGAALRDGAALFGSVLAVLEPLGLADPAGCSPPAETDRA